MSAAHVEEVLLRGGFLLPLAGCCAAGAPGDPPAAGTASWRP